MFTALVAALLIAQHHAPKDVPESHWAFKAVDELFSAGILHGYPEDHLSLTAVSPDGKWLISKLRQWKMAGLLVGYPDGLSKTPIDPSNPYEQAVAIHAVWADLDRLFTHETKPGDDTRALLADFDDLARAISMRSRELTKLGGDPQAMVADLAQIRSRENGTLLFRG